MLSHTFHIGASGAYLEQYNRLINDSQRRYSTKFALHSLLYHKKNNCHIHFRSTKFDVNKLFGANTSRIWLHAWQIDYENGFALLLLL